MARTLNEVIGSLPPDQQRDIAVASDQLIAGHKFEDGRCVCGVLWVDLAGATYEHVGKPGWSHTGVLNITDLWDIQMKVDKLWLAGGSS